jgi:hypothetical protein
LHRRVELVTRAIEPVACDPIDRGDTGRVDVGARGGDGHDTYLEVHVAAPDGATGTVIVDIGLLEFRVPGSRHPRGDEAQVPPDRPAPTSPSMRLISSATMGREYKYPW